MATRQSNDYLKLWRSEFTNHYNDQKYIYKRITEGKTAANKIGDFLNTKIWGWVYHYVKSRFGVKHDFMDYNNKSSNGVFKAYSKKSESGNNIKVVMAADWGSDTPESDFIGEKMKQENGDYTIHLGDVYYVGEPKEVEQNFLSPNASWPKGSSGTLALPGNHEFYSNGNGYFNKLLPRMFVETKEGIKKQEASFFCLENDYWRIIGLDTGYHSVGLPIIEWLPFFKPKAELDDKEIDWLKDVVKLNNPNDKRGLIILAHHQYCSVFDKLYPKPAEQLAEFIGRERKTIWLWGHEHRFAVYGKYSSKKGITTYGRCMGNGGMPVELEKEDWKPDPDDTKEFNLVFHDNRERKRIKKTRIGHNGYTVMQLNNEKIEIEYKDENTWLFRESWEVDLNTGTINALNVETNQNVPLTLCSDTFSDAVK